MSEKLEIRESTPSDLGAIESLYPEAFPDEDLLPLVRDLLEDVAIRISPVGAIDSRIVGHAIFTKCGVVGSNVNAALLGPLAIAPAWHRRGFGRAIVCAGLQRLQEMDVSLVCVLGDPAYYERLGFRPETLVEPPFRLPPEWDGAWQSQIVGDMTMPVSGKLSVPRQWLQPALWAPSPTNAGGTWEGSITDDNSGQTSAIVSVITETAGANALAPEEGRFVDEQGFVFVIGPVGTWPDGSIHSNVIAFAPSGTVFAAGSTIATGGFDGTVIERSTLDASLSLNLGTGEMTNTISMTYNADYERGSDNARTTGTWADSFGVVYNIDAVGVIFAQDPGGCVYNGAVSVIYASFNAYRLRLTVSDCAGLDGDYLGLGVLGDDVGVDDAFTVQLDNGQVAMTDVLLKQ